MNRSNPWQLSIAALAATLGCIAYAGESIASVVDATFTSTITPRSSNLLRTQVMALADGDAIVEYDTRPGMGFGYDYYRLKPDGQLDPAAPQPVVASYWYYNAGSNFVAAVLDDGSFIMRTPPYRRDGGGAVVSSFSPPRDLLDASIELSAAAKQPDGKFLLAQDARLVRALANGTPDPAFAPRATTLTHVGWLLPLPGGGILVGDDADTNARRILRLTARGEVDPAFHAIAATGRVIGVTAEGEIVVAGTPDGDRLGFTRYRADGSLATTSHLTLTGPCVLAASGELYVAGRGLGIFRITNEPTPRIDPNFFAPADPGATIDSLAVLPDGKLLVGGSFTSWEGHATSNVVRLDPARAEGHGPVTVAIAPPRDALHAGGIVHVIGNAIGTGPLSYTWVSLDGGVLPAEIHSAILVFDSFRLENFGRYRLDVTSGEGTASATIDLRPPPPRLVNVSCRAHVGPGAETLIAGFVLDVSPGGRRYSLVLRGVGPALADLGVSSPLPDPMITLLDANGSLVAQNNDWTTNSPDYSLTWQAGSISYRRDSRDSLLTLTAPGGTYSLVLQDAGRGSGTALIEAYDVDRTGSTLPDQRDGSLANLSVRGQVGGADPLIAGFVIVDSAGFDRPLKILARVSGPALRQFGITNAVTDPRLLVYDTNAREIAANDDWSTASNADSIAAAARQVGAFEFPHGSKDAAVILELPPGAYTLQAASSAGATGLGLVELYRLP